jgi:hypothetical protein
MADEREKLSGKTANDEVKPDDVEAHKLVHQSDEAEEAKDDDVEAHKLSNK